MWQCEKISNCARDDGDSSLLGSVVVLHSGWSEWSGVLVVLVSAAADDAGVSL